MTRAAAPSLIDELLAAVMPPSRAKAGRRVGILAGSAFSGCSSVSTTLGPLAAGHGDRRDLGLEGAALDGVLGLGQAARGVVVHGLAAELVGGRRVLGEGAHQLAGRVGVLEAVQVHRVPHLVVADAGPGAVLGQQVGRAGHALHATGHHHVDRAGRQGVVGHDRGLHAAAAHLVDGGRLDGKRQARADRRLARGGLAEAGRQHAAHDDLLDLVARNAGPFDGRLDRRRAQFGGLHSAQGSLETAHRRAGEGDDDDGIGRRTWI
jgi:hypothetical protein